MIFAGFDVSVGRESETALVVWDYDPATEKMEIRHIDVETLTDAPAVVDWIAEQEERYKFDAIAVDAIGVGRGILDYVNQRPFAHKVFAFIASAKASRESEDEETRTLMEKTYSNLKTRTLVEMRNAARQGRIAIPQMPYHERLIEELQQYRLKKMDGRWKSEDPKRSPDVGDAAIVGFSLLNEAASTFWLGN